MGYWIVCYGMIQNQKWTEFGNIIKINILTKASLACKSWDWIGLGSERN